MGVESCFESRAGIAVDPGGMEGDKVDDVDSFVSNAFRTSVRNDRESSIGGVRGFAVGD